jgi:hypothetical protein
MSPCHIILATRLNASISLMKRQHFCSDSCTTTNHDNLKSTFFYNFHKNDQMKTMQTTKNFYKMFKRCSVNTLEKYTRHFHTVCLRQSSNTTNFFSVLISGKHMMTISQKGILRVTVASNHSIFLCSLSAGQFSQLAFMSMHPRLLAVMR